MNTTPKQFLKWAEDLINIVFPKKTCMWAIGT